MVSLRGFKQKFNVAAAIKDSLLQGDVIMSLNENVDENILDQVFDPIRQMLTNDQFYSNREIGAYDLIKELRQICNEVQARHMTDDYIVRLGRNDLLNTLQAILESVEDSKDNIVTIERGELYALPNLTNVIRANAQIYREFMKSPLMADMLYQVADNIDMAQLTLWKTNIRSNYSFTPNVETHIEHSEEHIR